MMMQNLKSSTHLLVVDDVCGSSHKLSEANGLDKKLTGSTSASDSASSELESTGHLIGTTKFLLKFDIIRLTRRSNRRYKKLNRSGRHERKKRKKRFKLVKEVHTPLFFCTCSGSSSQMHSFHTKHGVVLKVSVNRTEPKHSKPLKPECDVSSP